MTISSRLPGVFHVKEHSIGLTQIIGHMDSVDRSFIFFSRISIISFRVN
jgi:hypothetical protein